MIDEQPLNAQGKVDRRRLEELAGEPGNGTTVVGPASDAKVRIAAIFAETLGHDQVGVTDNLFRLGADSVQIVAIRQRLSAEFGRELALARMFENTSIRTLTTAFRPRPGSLRTTRRRPVGG
ncbi:phosphopantetheine-binding protein [Amycolatopsis sp. FDAARGOS 1241]|uniref:phosphopantetheine-binding protein n=1 Tax=Amycolatopsis sp. FDAARGOS 1241 TaxID=2778070 RepID=UPI00195230D8|nr:phosphopantetheine-binding protein [Amycolatopsis sp. FDAARGOS 1241]QRP47964.1 hypothetical protein I6J71_08770 [Amycolatopsis sp. FDAARGOS 1241]